MHWNRLAENACWISCHFYLRYSALQTAGSPWAISINSNWNNQSPSHREHLVHWLNSAYPQVTLLEVVRPCDCHNVILCPSSTLIGPSCPVHLTWPAWWLFCATSITLRGPHERISKLLMSSFGEPADLKSIKLSCFKFRFSTNECSLLEALVIWRGDGKYIQESREG